MDTTDKKIKSDWYSLVRPENATMRRGRMAEWMYRKNMGTESKPSDLALAVDKRTVKVKPFAKFGAELFASLYDGGACKSLPEKDRNSTVAGLLNAARECGEFDALADSASVHDSIAVEATKTLVDAVAKAAGIDALPDPKPGEDTDPQDISSQIEVLKQMPVEAGSEAEQAQQEALAELEQALQQAVSRQRSINAKIKKAVADGTLSQAVTAAAGKAAEKANAVRALRGAGFGTEAGESGSDPIDAEAIAAVSKIEDFNLVLDLLGKMQQEAEAEDAMGAGKITPVGMTQGDDLSHLSSSEWAKESVDEMLFLDDLLAKRTTQTELEDEEPKAKGGKLILVDCSGSMGKYKLAWARAIGLAAAMRSEKDGLHWAFSMYNTQNYCTNSSKGIKDALRVAQRGASGGTSTDYCVRDLLQQQDLGAVVDPDILLLTDGEWEPLSEETLALLKDKKFRLFVVMLEGGHGDPVGATKVWHIPSASSTDLNAQTAGEILSALSRK